MTSPLDPDRTARRETVESILSFVDGWLDPAADGSLPAGGGENPDQDLLARLQHSPAESGTDLSALLELLSMASQGGIYHPAGGHMSYIPNSGLFDGAVGEFLAAALNRYTGVSAAAPGFTAIEHGLVRWLCDLFDFGPSSSGLLLSGGSMANFTGIVTARTVKLGDAFSDGVVYFTSHTHHSAAKAARLAGIRNDQLVQVPVDANLRMDVAALDGLINRDREAGLRPFLVIASAGTTDTGHVDPLNAVANVAAANNLWMHVDAAYGGFFQLTERGRKALAGIDRAHSIALDPHKGLSIPFGLGALVVRDESSLVDAHQGRGAYLRDEDSYLGLRDISSLGPELSRPFRGLPMWLPLHLHGVAPFRATLDSSLDLARYAYDRLRGVGGIKTPWKPDLSIVAFRFDDDELGKAALEAVNADGYVHLSPTVVDGNFVLRLAILNRRTTQEHIDHAIDIIEKTIIG